VTIGRAFHWMERAATLDVLDAMIEPSGAVVLFGDNHPDVPENSWHNSCRKIIENYSTGDVVREKLHSPEWLAHEAILLASPFAEMERISIIERRVTPIERFTDRALSFSSTSRQRLGAKAGNLIRELEELMAKFASNGHVSEVVESTALIAKRSRRSSGI